MTLRVLKTFKALLKITSLDTKLRPSTNLNIHKPLGQNLKKEITRSHKKLYTGKCAGWREVEKTRQVFCLQNHEIMEVKLVFSRSR